MRLLVINDEVRSTIKKLIEYAESHQYSLDDLLDIKNKQLSVAGDEPEFSCEIPDGFRVVYTIENQPMGKVRHISISISGEKGKLPNPAAVEMIISEFGFKNKLEDCHVSIEKDIAINVIDKY